MSRNPAPAAPAFPLADGLLALPAGFAFLRRSRVLLVADAHFGYEAVMGGGAALPVWSTSEMVASIAIAARRTAAREIVFLGDILHSPRLSTGAMRAVAGGLAGLRELAALTYIAGNHEGRSRGRAVLGATVEMCERDGWLLVHGDRPTVSAARTVIGHLHPSLQLAGEVSAPAFLAGERLVVVPALTPYSRGLDILSDACIAALAPWDVRCADLHVVAVTNDLVYPFGTLSTLRSAVGAPDAGRPAGPFMRRRRLERSQ